MLIRNKVYSAVLNALGKTFREAVMKISDRLVFSTRLVIRMIAVEFVILFFSTALANDVQFNTDILDVSDRENINLNNFAKPGYVTPGTYPLIIKLNRRDLPEQNITFYSSDANSEISEACLTQQLVEQFALKPERQKDLLWQRQGQCLDTRSIPGMSVAAQMRNQTLVIGIPVDWLEYQADNWEPPSRWDDGIPGVIADYNLNLQAQRTRKIGKQYTASGNGLVGANVGPWRLRANWQGRYQQAPENQSKSQQFDWTSFYATRSLPEQHAKLTVGETVSNASLIDNFRFTGVSLASDTAMLPPGLRGYAPEIMGVAQSNAKVTVSQQGRVLYETQVPPGPFRIQNLSDAVAGKLDVRIEEQGGSVQEYQVDTASIPYLTRPGQVRYTLSAGKPSSLEHRTNGPAFSAGEFSWGVSNGWSLLGGALLSAPYQSLTAGIGRDLLTLGALALDTTFTRAHFNTIDDQKGASVRLSYAKRFEESNSQITFAGYRFSERGFLSMNDYLGATESGRIVNNSKQLYTLSLSKVISDWNTTALVRWSHQTWWDKPPEDRYEASLSRYMDVGRFKNVSMQLGANHNASEKVRDSSVYFSVSMPWGANSTVNYSTSFVNDNAENRVGYFQRLNERDNWQLSAGLSNNKPRLSSYFTHAADSADLSANISTQPGGDTSLGFAAQGGMTATAEGGAFHRISVPGATRLMVDTDGVANVPVRGAGTATRSNAWGKAVITDVSSFLPSRASIDVDKLDDKTEAIRSVVNATLTEGAIGFRKFSVLAGDQSMAKITLPDGASPPFGAEVRNKRQQQTGLVGDNGEAYLSGLLPKGELLVEWGENDACKITLPESLPFTHEAMLDLLCTPIS